MGSVQHADSPPASDSDRRAATPFDDGGSDARITRQVVARYARTFSMASWLLPLAKRRAAFAVYATCRVADDIVDVGAADRATSLNALRQFREQAFRALEQRADQPILRELARAWHAYELPDAALNELFDGLELDLNDGRYETWPELERYCQAVAGSVGAICCSIFGVADDHGSLSRAVGYARTLGVAMQLTNILRDVGEDARRGRCYLPTGELRQHGLEPESIVSGSVTGQRDAWLAFLRLQIDRARDLYRQALPGIRLLAPDARPCALACATGYARILDAIEAAGGDTLSRRVSAPRLTLLGVVWRSWRQGATDLPDARGATGADDPDLPAP